jgi:hypothetical protein
MTAEREETDVAERDAAAEWVRPPRLATGEERTASRLELFYDLAYVLVVAELASALLKDLSWSGAAPAGVGIEELVMHPYAVLPAPPGWTAIGGIALALIGAGIVLVGAHKRLSALWPWPVVAIAPLLLLTVLDVPVLVLVGLLGLTTVAVAVSGARQRARRGVTLA